MDIIISRRSHSLKILNIGLHMLDSSCTNSPITVGGKTWATINSLIKVESMWIQDLGLPLSLHKDF
jgi:hypothetical protein